MVFSFRGRQKGAIENADARGIATVVFRDGRGEYLTRWLRGPSVEPAPWAPVHPVIGQRLSITQAGEVRVRRLAGDDVRTITSFWPISSTALPRLFPQRDRASHPRRVVIAYTTGANAG